MFLGGLGELDYHSERSLLRKASFGAHDAVTHGRKRAFDNVGNLYEISRCQRSAAVFYIVAYGATMGTKAPGARSGATRRELEL